jgi:hypothetical protein
MPEAPQAEFALQQDLVASLTSAYAMLMKRQRTASAAFVRWSTANRRAHEFAWLEPGKELILSEAKEIHITADHPLHDSLNKMRSTIELNPYERELLYGYPYVVGHVHDVPIRAPLLTIPIVITSKGNTLIVGANEELVRFNSLPFRSEFDTAAHELVLNRLIDATPAFPVNQTSLKEFCANVSRELHVAIKGMLDFIIKDSPQQPQGPTQLSIVDCAACFAERVNDNETPLIRI